MDYCSVLLLIFLVFVNRAIFLEIIPGYADLHRSHKEEPLVIAGMRILLQLGCPSCHLTNSVKALLGLGLVCLCYVETNRSQ